MEVAMTDFSLTVLRWIHFMAGITWIGLLYYFNFVQVPAMKAATEDQDKGGVGPAAISKHVAPLALLWFRWSALVTWIAGAAYLVTINRFVDSFALGLNGNDIDQYALTIGIGAWLGTIMLFNVWAIIWPNQKKVLGLSEASDVEKGLAKRRAFLASRTNTMLSIPMLLFMGAASHGLHLFG